MTSSKEILNWAYEKNCQKAVESLKKNGFTAVYCTTRKEAVDYIVNQAKEASTIGFGGSMTLVELNVAEVLKEMGKELLNHNAPNLSSEEKMAIRRRQLTCDLFLTSTNALTLTGNLVNIDGTGNRAASMFFGPRKIIIIAGRNKIVGSIEEGLNRIKMYAAPANARRLNLSTPCASTGFCADCNSPERICRITTILERKPLLTDIHVLVVNEDLGF
ncbi:lactate utilization protein [Thermovenabulum sp.]|uniref:lactate utilization protein n=1 Tax=Thermovenabulum sp. TaxID=3100335 RepID=UPI003C7B1BBA